MKQGRKRNLVIKTNSKKNRCCFLSYAFILTVSITFYFILRQLTPEKMTKLITNETSANRVLDLLTLVHGAQIGVINRSDATSVRMMFNPVLN